MLKITIKYFLNASGLKYFDQWYEKVAKITAKQEGFISINCQNNQKEPLIYLYFENEEKLSVWAATEIHDKLASELETHFIHPQEVNFEEIDNSFQKM